jgi:hypothetical protein
MSGSDPRASFTAGDGSHVGFQAGEVSGGTFYIDAPTYRLSSGATPKQQYAVGVRYLADGVPVKARELIRAAIDRGLDSAEVRFQWVMALLSKRSYRDLGRMDREELAALPEILPRYLDDEWTRALVAVYELLQCLRTHGSPDLALKKVHELKDEQRSLIIRHLDLVLTGGIKDSLWAQSTARAESDREGNGRRDRMWACFQAKPMQARAREAEPSPATGADDAVTAVRAALCVLLASYTGWTVIMTGRLLPICALAAVLGAGYFAARARLEWRCQSDALAAKESEYVLPTEEEPLGNGFTSRVESRFVHYFTKYAPDRFELEDWLAGSAGIRRTLRVEIAEIYRESRIPVERIDWIIRFLAIRASKTWNDGSAWDFREQYQVPWRVKARSVAASAVMAIAAAEALGTLLSTHSILALLAAAGAIKAGRDAVGGWIRRVSEGRQARRREVDFEIEYAVRQAEYDRWKAKLEEVRPQEEELEYWLYCDKVIWLRDALNHYRLAWRDVLAHAFLLVPAPGARRFRVEGGQPRYSHYMLRLFLITDWGVREAGTALDFAKAEFHGQDRANYSYSSVSSVRVAVASEFEYTIELTLTNGPAQPIRVTEPVMIEEDSTDDPIEVARMDLDATGFSHALHILEGIAAEGRAWIDRDPLQDESP